MGGQLGWHGVSRAGTERIDAVVCEATYGSSKWQVKDKLAQLGPPWLVQWAEWLVADGSLAALDVSNELQQVPILFVHGQRNTVVLAFHSQWLHSRLKSSSELWMEKDKGHLQVFTDSINQSGLVEYLIPSSFQISTNSVCAEFSILTRRRPLCPALLCQIHWFQETRSYTNQSSFLPRFGRPTSLFW